MPRREHRIAIMLGPKVKELPIEEVFEEIRKHLGDFIL